MKNIQLRIKTNNQNYLIIIGSHLTKEISKILNKNSILFKKCLLVIDNKNIKEKIFEIKKNLRKKNVFIIFIKSKRK